MDTRTQTGKPFEYDNMTPTVDAANRMISGDELFVKAFYMGALDAAENPQITTDRLAIIEAFRRRQARDAST